MTDPKTSPLRSVTIYFSSLRSCWATIRNDCSFFVLFINWVLKIVN